MEHTKNLEVEIGVSRTSRILIYAPDKNVAAADVYYTITGPIRRAEAIANARLWAAAPEQVNQIIKLREQLAEAKAEIARLQAEVKKWKPVARSAELGFLLDKPPQGPRVRPRRTAKKR